MTQVTQKHIYVYFEFPCSQGYVWSTKPVLSKLCWQYVPNVCLWLTRGSVLVLWMTPERPLAPSTPAQIGLLLSKSQCLCWNEHTHSGLEGCREFNLILAVPSLCQRERGWRSNVTRMWFTRKYLHFYFQAYVHALKNPYFKHMLPLLDYFTHHNNAKTIISCMMWTAEKQASLWNGKPI